MSAKMTIGPDKTIFEINHEGFFQYATNGNYIKDLPSYLMPMFVQDDYNPIAAFMANVQPDRKIKIKITLEV